MAITSAELPDIFTEPVFKPVKKHLRYLKKKLDNYSAHLFVLLPKDEQELEKFWDILNARIAVGFQTELELSIEKWNIYFLILCKFKVSRQLKYTIEQNKYCSRKLVEDQLKLPQKTDAFIQHLIDEKIFTLTVPVIPSPEKLISTTTAEIITEDDPYIVSALKGFTANNKQFDKFYKQFKKLAHGTKKH
jgi:hypothetical protein